MKTLIQQYLNKKMQDLEYVNSQDMTSCSSCRNQQFVILEDQVKSDLLSTVNRNMINSDIYQQQPPLFQLQHNLDDWIILRQYIMEREIDYPGCLSLDYFTVIKFNLQTGLMSPIGKKGSTVKNILNFMKKISNKLFIADSKKVKWPKRLCQTCYDYIQVFKNKINKTCVKVEIQDTDDQHISEGKALKFLRIASSSFNLMYDKYRNRQITNKSFYQVCASGNAFSSHRQVNLDYILSDQFVYQNYLEDKSKGDQYLKQSLNKDNKYKIIFQKFFIQEDQSDFQNQELKQNSSFKFLDVIPDYRREPKNYWANDMTLVNRRRSRSVQIYPRWTVDNRDSDFLMWQMYRSKYTMLLKKAQQVEQAHQKLLRLKKKKSDNLESIIFTEICKTQNIREYKKTKQLILQGLQYSQKHLKKLQQLDQITKKAKLKQRGWRNIWQVICCCCPYAFNISEENTINNQKKYKEEINYFQEHENTNDFENIQKFKIAQEDDKFQIFYKDDFIKEVQENEIQMKDLSQMKKQQSSDINFG